MHADGKKGNPYQLQCVLKNETLYTCKAIAGAQNSDRGRYLTWHADHLPLLMATTHLSRVYQNSALGRLLDPEVLMNPEALDQFPTEQRHHYFACRIEGVMVDLN